jgi:hypothetical protein
MTDVVDKYFPGVPRHDLVVFLAFTFFMMTIGFAAGWLVAKYIW